MVTFELESITSDKAVYKYFPENHRESAYGVFSISLVNGDVVLEVVAEEDHLCRTSASGINVKLKIHGYRPTNKDNWDSEWCRCDFLFSSGDWLNYHKENDEVLLAS